MKCYKHFIKILPLLQLASKIKCYKHPEEDAIGICSKCGRGICTQCAETSHGRLICKDCLKTSTALTLKRLKAYSLVGALIGWLGFVNTTLLGTYIALYCLRLASWDPSFLRKAYIAGITAVASAFMLLYGGYLIWRGRIHMGGMLNLMAGTITTILYLYFTFGFPLLGQLGPIGYILLVPALMSGLIGILISRRTRRS